MRSEGVVAGRFEIERLAGSGGMGAIYRARDRVTDEHVALKMLIGSPEARTERFAREARLLSELRHPHIVRYLAHGVTLAGEPYLAMEWLEGEDLDARLGRERLTTEQSVEVVRLAAEGLAIAHARGVVHRDVKPSNLFLVQRDVARVKVLDFGLARAPLLTIAGGRTRPGAALGTPGYMAPEQARGDACIDARADVFALGCVLFECLTGEPAFSAGREREPSIETISLRSQHGEPVFVDSSRLALLAKILATEPQRPSLYNPEVPAELDELVVRMLSKDPAARPSDAGVVARELARTPPVPSGHRPPPSTNSRRTLTRDEQRLVNVIFVATDGSDEARAKLRHVLVPVGARIDALPDGAVIATLSGKAHAGDQASVAARCALAVRRALPEAPIAVATGRGDVSGETPTGEVIERAARLLALGSRGVWVDAVTASLVDGQFDVACEHGRNDLRAERADRSAVRTLLGKASGLVGRERELSLLAGILAECVSDSVAHAVLVTGAAGVGKSRLLHEWTRGLERAGEVEAWFCRGDPMRAGSPFGLLAEGLRSASRLLDGEPLETRREKLTSRLARNLPGDQRDRIVEFIGELMGVPLFDEPSVSLRTARADARLMGDQTARALEDLLRAEATAHPLVLVLEDLHWGDVSTVKLIDGVLATLRDRPLMILALARPEVRDLFPALWARRAFTHVQLPELSRRASERLVRNVLGDDVDAAVLESVLDRAQGNALFLEELVRAVAAGGGDALPETLLAIMQARLEAVPPDARRVLRAASVFGRTFWASSVRALLGDGAAEGRLDDWLSDVVEREIVEPVDETRFAGERAFRFRHALVADAAYSLFTEDDRALGHRLAGAWLERMGERDAMPLAEHLERGGLRARAAAHFARAAEQALEGNDLEGTVGRADRAIACGAEGEHLVRACTRKAEALYWKAEHAASIEAAKQAMELCAEGSRPRLEASYWMANSAFGCGRADVVSMLARQFLDLTPTPETVAAYSRAGTRIAFTEWLQGNLESADRLFTKVIALEEEIGGNDVNARLRKAVMRVARSLTADAPDEFLAASQESAAVHREVGDLRQELLARVNVANGHMLVGAFARVEADARAILEAREYPVIPRILAAAKNVLGIALAHRGQIAEGLRFEREAVSAFDEQGDHRYSAMARIDVARILLLAGEPDEAALEARRARETAKDFPQSRAHADAILARALLTLGEANEAFEATRRAHELLESLGVMEDGAATVRLVFAEAQRALGLEGAAAASLDAEEKLLARADRIKDSALRESFLGVPEHAATLALARAWRQEPT